MFAGGVPCSCVLIEIRSMSQPYFEFNMNTAVNEGAMAKRHGLTVK